MNNMSEEVRSISSLPTPIKSANDKKQSVNNTPHESATTSVDVNDDRDKNEYGSRQARWSLSKKPCCLTLKR